MFFSYTDNDIVSIDTAGLLSSGALFGDTTNAAPLGTSISYAGPRHGYAVVYNSPDYFQSGFWMEIDIANGGAHGDHGVMENAYDDIDDDFTLTGDQLALRSATNAEDLDYARAVPFWPSATVSTVFTVTPLGSAMMTSENTSVVLQVKNFNGVQGAYDRNENGIDGTVPQTVRCVGRLTAAQLMPGVVANAAWAATGGWGFMQNRGDGDATFGESCSSSGDCEAMVYQIDTSNAAGAGKFMSNATRVSSDNGEYPYGRW